MTLFNLFEKVFWGNATLIADKSENEKQLKTLLAFGDSNNTAASFKNINAMIINFKRFSVQPQKMKVLYKLFFGGVLPAYLLRNKLLEDFLKSYNKEDLIKYVSRKSLGNSEEEKKIIIDVLEEIDLKHIVRTIAEYIETNRKNEICKFVTINLYDSNIVDCNDFCDDVLLLFESVNAK
ncbi:hypothetical protein [Nitratiruptor sp. SB155-2]|uniref:hypothetical protein n=1 Tax=Nitratiruptor sp. (strain SB155-2) TaxID=387092 RepID=UPI0001586FA6|nr:hypothetical protein [Nitratiruptor sp. SB155-2]BAF70795.1 hypothetical protein NIS_1689 [Nitratiruptor sp. SB155-2]